jgi:hypothetical protein
MALRASLMFAHDGWVIPISFEPQYHYILFKGGSIIGPVPHLEPQKITHRVSFFATVLYLRANYGIGLTEGLGEHGREGSAELSARERSQSSNVRAYIFAFPNPPNSPGDSIIHKIISKEEQYLQDLDTVQTVSFDWSCTEDSPSIMLPALTGLHQTLTRG